MKKQERIRRIETADDAVAFMRKTRMKVKIDLSIGGAAVLPDGFKNTGSATIENKYNLCSILTLPEVEDLADELPIPIAFSKSGDAGVVLGVDIGDVHYTFKDLMNAIAEVLLVAAEKGRIRQDSLDEEKMK